MATAAYNSQVWATSSPSVTLTNESMSTSDLTTWSIVNIAHRALDKGTAAVVQAAHDEIQTITVTGGSFTLTFGANTTGSLSSSATAATVQTALQGLASVGAGNALVSGANGGPYTVQFTATLGQASQSLMTSSGATIARVQAGSAFATISSGFTLYYANAHVTFTVAQVQGTYVRLASGKYFPLVQVAQAHSSEFTGKVDMIDTSYFQSAGVYSYTPGLLSGTLKFDSWWMNMTMINNLVARSLLIGSFVLPSGNRYEGYLYLSDLDLKNDIKSAVDEMITCQLTDSFFAA
jgi:hypothetical protein